MQAVCKNCNTKYIIDSDKIATRKNITFSCKNCDKKIKIIRCPTCNAFYSITYSGVVNKNYYLQCQKCNKKITVNFTEINPKKKSVNEDKPSQKKIKKQNETKTQLQLFDIFKVLFQSLNFKNLLTGFIASFIFIIANFSVSWIERIFFNISSNGNFSFPLLYIKLFYPFLFFLFFIISGSIISKRLILQVNLFSNFKNNLESNKSTNSSEIFFISGWIFASFFIIYSLILLFGKISTTFGIIFYAIATLPIYLLLTFMFLKLILFFWYSPTILATTNGGFLIFFEKFKTFVKNNTLKILYITPLSFLFSLGILFILYAINFIFIHLIKFITLILPTNKTIPSFLLIPSNFLSLWGSSFSSFYFKIITLFSSGDIINSLLLFIISLVSIFVILILLSIFLSSFAAISTFTYFFIKQEISNRDKQNIKKLFIFSGLTAIILLIIKIAISAL